jgi:hypothetical protein
MFECFSTTSLLVLGLAFEYCTFLFELMEKNVFPQFKPLVTYKILNALYCNRLEDGNP